MLIKKLNKIFLLIHSILIIFVACKTSQKSLQSVSTQNVRLKNYGITKLLDSINNKYLDYQTLSIKFKLNIKLSDENHILDGILRIRKDSIIWISLNVPLGIELARIVLNNDSIYIINKLKKEYYIKSYHFFEQNYHVELTYNDIQALLTNKIFLISESDEEKNLAMNENSSEKDFVKKNFFIGKDSVNYILKTHRKHRIKKAIRRNKTDNIILESIKILPSEFKIQQIEIIDFEENRKLIINYDNFNTFNNKLFPTSINIQLSDSLNKYNIELQYLKININTEINTRYTIPDNYIRIP